MNRLYWIFVCLFLLASCKRHGNATTAFYYWKSTFQIDAKQGEILHKAADDQLYVRFFDVSWNDRSGQAFPDAVLQFNQSAKGLHITPVIFIKNKTFEKITDKYVDTLAINCNTLINRMAAQQAINYTAIQIDCDWTQATQPKYFAFLRSFKQLNHRVLEATIRLHQVKYKERTGIPPIDKGILMFYNMGKLNANLKQANSIYNKSDAQPYIASIKSYPLPLDVALPMFSWAVQTRDGAVVQIYNKIDRAVLNNHENFESTNGNNIYRAVKSFFLSGIYIKENDIFKFEEITTDDLNRAAKQLADHLLALKNRNIIYYELSSPNVQAFDAETIREVSGSF